MDEDRGAERDVGRSWCLPEEKKEVGERAVGCWSVRDVVLSKGH